MWRPLHDGWLVTLSLSNTQVAPEITDSAKQTMENNWQLRDGRVVARKRAPTSVDAW
ncbi:hypothetical protein [Thiocystis violascens]|uniref:hypothetical protein n=1 Tax=Thiocystis violascens TaxID=73141 RepID=UPI00030C71A9|nr:hypothetical protein [Thiocystis violascens]